MLDSNLGSLNMVPSSEDSGFYSGIVSIDVESIRYQFGSKVFSVGLNGLVVDKVTSDLALDKLPEVEFSELVYSIMYQVLRSNLLNPSEANYKSYNDLVRGFQSFITETIEFYDPESFKNEEVEVVVDFEELMSSPRNYNLLEVRALVESDNIDWFSQLYFGPKVGDDAFRELRLDVLDALSFDQVESLINKYTTGYKNEYGQFFPSCREYSVEVIYGDKMFYNDEDIYRYYLLFISTHVQ